MWLRQPGCLIETRGFPSLPRGGFGFLYYIFIVIIEIFVVVVFSQIQVSYPLLSGTLDRPIIKKWGLLVESAISVRAEKNEVSSDAYR